MVEKRPSNPLALAVLPLLYERPMHPYEISSTLKERQKEASIKLNYGSLYSVVESLVKRGLVEPRETVREGKRPERTIYAITATGRTTMVDWLSELLSVPVKEFPQFEAALSLMPVLPPDEVARLLRTRLEQLRRQHQVGRGMLGQAEEMQFPRLFVIEHEYELALQAAEIEFVDALLREIEDGTFEGVAIWRRLHELRSDGVPTEDAWGTIRDEFTEEAAWLTDQ